MSRRASCLILVFVASLISRTGANLEHRGRRHHNRRRQPTWSSALRPSNCLTTPICSSCNNPYTYVLSSRHDRKFDATYKRRPIVERLRGGSSNYDNDAPSRPRSQSPPSSSSYGGRYQGEDRYSRSYDNDPQQNQDDFDPYGKSSSPSSPYREPWEEDRGPYYDDYGDDYSDKNRPRPRDDTSSTGIFWSMLPSVVQTGDKRIGLVLLGAGTVVTMLGMSLFFNKTLMRLGNLLFIAGVPMTLGPTKVMGYFWQPQKARATACLALGIFLVFVGWPVFGMILEVFGLLNLFGNLFPVLLAIAKQMPIVGNILNAGGGSNKSNKNGRQRERYYDEEDDYYYAGRRDQGPRDDDEHYY